MKGGLVPGQLILQLLQTERTSVYTGHSLCGPSVSLNDELRPSVIALVSSRSHNCSLTRLVYQEQGGVSLRVADACRLSTWGRGREGWNSTIIEVRFVRQGAPDCPVLHWTIWRLELLAAGHWSLSTHGPSPAFTVILTGSQIRLLGWREEIEPA